MAVANFHDQEAEYAAYRKSGLAYVANGLNMGTDWIRLHRTDCPFLGSDRYERLTSVAKACSRDKAELIAWLRINHGPEGDGYQVCAACERTGPV